MADSADPNAVRLRIEQEVVSRARIALERSDLNARVRLRLGGLDERAVA